MIEQHERAADRPARQEIARFIFLESTWTAADDLAGFDLAELQSDRKSVV